MELDVPEKKRRQHYVWRHYLDAWTTDGRIWCKHEERVFPASTENVAHERDFYRVREVSQGDLDQIRRVFLSKMHPMVQEQAELRIPMFTFPFKVLRDYRASGHTLPGAEEMVDAVLNNAIEDVHAGTEVDAVPLLAALRRGDWSLYDNDERFPLLAYFLSMQMFRTPGIVSRMTRTLSGYRNFNAENSVGLLCIIFALSSSFGLCGSRSKLRVTFLDAPMDAELITGDEPMINVRAFGLNGVEPPTEFEVYYPLSPTSAVLFDFDAVERGTARRVLRPMEVATYNWMIAQDAFRQTYAASRTTLEASGGPGRTRA